MQCKQCQNEFTITDQDRQFYHKIGVPEPKMCPDCRQQNRLAFRNEKSFYLRKCDLCGKETVSVFSQDKNYTVYCQKCWWDDGWDPLKYGRDFDFSQSFFEQLYELEKTVPAISILNKQSVNSEYTNVCAQNKNCYMLVESSDNEDCYYSYWIQRCRDCIDISFCHEVELSYECDYCYQSYGLLFCQNCENCREGHFLFNCRGCSNCFSCVNLVNKQYNIFNHQKTEKEYKDFLQSIDSKDISQLGRYKSEFREFCLKFPHKYAEIVKSENCSGDYINRSKRCLNCYHAHEAEDCSYSVHVWRKAKDCCDVDTSGMNTELIYNSINTAIKSYGCIGCRRCWTVSDLRYCINCDNCKNNFGCIGLRHKEFCILNKQYTEGEYNQLTLKIIEKMTRIDEWGNFMPVKFSPFSYNETVAQEYFPLSKEEVMKSGWSWRDEEQRVPDPNLPTCINCGKNFKIIPQEEKFYQKFNLSLPVKCFNCRHLDRMKLRSPRKLWSRQCAKCGIKVETTYAPERPEIIYCEDCYQKEMY